MPANRVLILENQAALTHFAAAFLAHLAQAAVAERGRCLLALSGGSTPRPVYSLLAQPPLKDTFPWRETHFLLGDERLVPADHPESNLFQARTLMLDPAGVPEQNIHSVLGDQEPQAAADDYADALAALAEPDRKWPRLDIAVNGLGADGHTASLFPEAENPQYTRPVVAVQAAYADRPAHRITMTPLVFNDVRNLIYLVAGAEKATAVAAALEGPGDPARCPTQRLRPAAGRVFWLLDEAAAAQLSSTAPI